MMKWFKHDSNANTDAKLKRVKLKYGMEGYGLYWFCLELISQTVEKHNLTFELEHDSELISMDTGIHQERVQEMMEDFVKWGLFENTQGIITCLKMATRTDEYTQKLIKQVNSLPTSSRQPPDSVGTKSELKEEKRIEQNRNETTVDKIPYQRIVDCYHEILVDLPKIKSLTPKRKSYIKKICNSKNDKGELRNTLKWWKEYFIYVKNIKFLHGDNDRNWTVNLEWITKPENFIKIIEGNYK